MPTIYKTLEPQPEIEFYFSHANSAWYAQFKHVDTYDGEMCFVPPHKPGDEIEYERARPMQTVSMDEGDKPRLKAKGIVKSCKPVQKDGKFVWEIELT